MSKKSSASKTSWSLLIEEMMQTDKWANYSPRYQADLEEVFEDLVEKIAKADVARLTQTDIYDAMDKNRHRVRFANYIPTAISMLSKLTGHGQRCTG